MFKTLLASLALATAAVSPASAQSVRFGIVLGEPYQEYREYRPSPNYVHCRRPNGQLGILTDYYGRPVTRYSYRYTNGLKCAKVRTTRIYDRQYEGRGWGQYR